MNKMGIPSVVGMQGEAVWNELGEFRIQIEDNLIHHGGVFVEIQLKPQKIIAYGIENVWGY